MINGFKKKLKKLKQYKKIFKRRVNLEDSCFLILRQYHYSNQTSEVLAKDTHVDGQKKTENQEIEPHKYTQLIFHNGAKSV